MMSRILASGLTFHDTEELLWEALETDGISPAVAETAAAFGGPPILAVPGIGGTAEASERAQRPMWRATYLLAMARRLQRSIDESLARAVPDEDWKPLRAAIGTEAPYLRQHLEEGRSRLAAAQASDASRGA